MQVSASRGREGEATDWSTLLTMDGTGTPGHSRSELLRSRSPVTLSQRQDGWEHKMVLGEGPEAKLVRRTGQGERLSVANLPRARLRKSSHSHLDFSFGPEYLPTPRRCRILQALRGQEKAARIGLARCAEAHLTREQIRLAASRIDEVVSVNITSGLILARFCRRSPLAASTHGLSYLCREPRGLGLQTRGESVEQSGNQHLRLPGASGILMHRQVPAPTLVVTAAAPELCSADSPRASENPIFVGPLQLSFNPPRSHNRSQTRSSPLFTPLRSTSVPLTKPTSVHTLLFRAAFMRAVSIFTSQVSHQNLLITSPRFLDGPMPTPSRYASLYVSASVQLSS